MKYLIKRTTAILTLTTLTWTLSLSDKPINQFQKFPNSPKLSAFKSTNNHHPNILSKLSDKIFGEIEGKSLHLQSAQAATDGTVGQGTYYPLNIFRLIKDMTAPLPDPSDCDSANSRDTSEDEGAYAFIAMINCHLANSIGVTGVGTFSETLNDSEGSGYFTVIVTENDNGYDYKARAWADYTNEDGTAHLKFMNYWFDAGGAKGLIEMFDDVPSGNTRIDMALRIQWDGTNSTAQTLTAAIHQNKDSGSTTDWSNREFAMRMSGTLNESTGVMSAQAAFNSEASQNVSMVISLVRNSTYSLAQGELRLGDGTTVNQAGTFQCIDNSKGTSGSSSEYTVRDADNSEANATDEGHCTGLSLPAASVDPTEANLGLLTSNYTLTSWDLNSSDQP